MERSENPKRHHKSKIAAWIVLYATVNYMGSIAPHLRPLASPFQRIALDVRSHTGPHDLVIVAGAGDAAQCEVDIPYFADRSCLSLHTLLTHGGNNLPLSWEMARAQIRGTIGGGHCVYVLDEVFYGRNALNGLAKRHPGVSRIQLDNLFSDFHRSVAWVNTLGPVWKLTTAGEQVAGPRKSSGLDRRTGVPARWATVKT